MTKKATKKQNTEFSFRDIKILYTLDNQIDVFFLSDDNTYNKSVNELILDWWYSRLWLYKADWLVEVNMWFNYFWHGVYYKEEEDYKAPIVTREKTFEEIKLEKENKWEQILFDNI